MKREEIKAIFADATDEQLKAVMDLNGKDIEKVKARVEALEADLEDKKEAFDNLTTELENLKANNATADDWKAKFEALRAENIAKEKQAEADRIFKEKQDNINNRFDTVLGKKKFTHDAIRDAYLKKFGDALDSKDFEGKSDEEIFHALTKDDAAAFSGVTPVKLAGGTIKNAGSEQYGSFKEIMQIKDRSERRAALAANIAKGNVE